MLTRIGITSVAGVACRASRIEDQGSVDPASRLDEHDEAPHWRMATARAGRAFARGCPAALGVAVELEHLAPGQRVQTRSAVLHGERTTNLSQRTSAQLWAARPSAPWDADQNKAKQSL